MKKYLLFDLDGTLTDSMEGITNSVAYALESFGISVEDKTTLTPFIGPPLTDSFMEYYGFTWEDALVAVEKYREYFLEKGMFENKVYPGILPLLKELKEAGKSCIVATSKPWVQAEKIVEHFGISEYLDDLRGSELNGVRGKKEEVIRYALSENHIQDLDEVLMIGDRKHDVIGAHGAGVEVAGVLYGFGSREELTKAGADYLAEDVKGLRRLLLEELR